jgi:polysaccharide deacetylase family protein (PEP-CTERM system associated)
MLNFLTFDLEEYFHVSAYADHVDQTDWASYPSRVAESTDRILELLDQNRCLATFFVLGWVAEEKPEVVRRVAKAGHEIACHSLLHRRVYELTAEQFRNDTRRAKSVIEDVSGRQVIGYRAPSFSVTAASIWALEILVEEGFRYDSSIYPVEHPSYGMPKAPRTPFWIQTPSGPILEFPLTTLELAGRRSPVAGGAYLRMLPYLYTKWAVGYLNQRENSSVCVYVHPWEIDAGQPRLPGKMSSHLRHRMGLRSLERKLDRLIHEFPFATFGSQLPQADGAGDPGTNSFEISQLSQFG